jgi:DNA-binding NarL/FixJ family response regulator
MTTTYRTIIAGSVRLYCEGLAHRLAGHPSLTVVGTATELRHTSECVRALRPDVVLLDVSSRGALQFVPPLRAHDKLHIVAFAVGDDEADVIACAEAGVSAFVERTATLDDLVATVVRCVQGQLTLSPRTAATLLRRVASLARPSSSHGVVVSGELTSREAQILALVRQGLSNKQISAQLGIRLPTVKNHVHRVLEKLGVSRRGEAAALVRRFQ